MENTSLLSDTIRFNVGGNNARKMRRVRDVRNAANGEYSSNCCGASGVDGEQEPIPEYTQENGNEVVKTDGAIDPNAPKKDNTILGLKPMTFIVVSLVVLVGAYLLTNKE